MAYSVGPDEASTTSNTQSVGCFQAGSRFTFHLSPSSPGAMASLFEHVVRGQALLPAAAFLETAAASSSILLAGRLPSTTHTAALTGAVIAALLVLSSAPGEGQVIICRLDTVNGQCSVSSASHSNAQQTTHFQSQTAPIAADVLNLSQIDRLPATALTRYDSFI